MLPLFRVAVLIAFAYVAFALMGKSSSTAALASLGEAPVGDCSTTLAAESLQLAIDAVDYAGAVLIANGEIYRPTTVQEIEATMRELPPVELADGLSTTEADTLSEVLRLGRQMSYTEAADRLEQLLADTPTAVSLVSAGDEIDFSVLEQLRGNC